MLLLLFWAKSPSWPRLSSRCRWPDFVSCSGTVVAVVVVHDANDVAYGLAAVFIFRLTS